jgi:hypothetical protein
MISSAGQNFICRETACLQQTAGSTPFAGFDYLTVALGTRPPKSEDAAASDRFCHR